MRYLIDDTGSLTAEQISKFFKDRSRYGRAFVINMANREERMQRATRTLDSVGVKFERFEAINGKELIEVDRSWTEKFPVLSPNELGCLVSHLSLLSIMAGHPDENSFTLVFEDDVVTSATSIEKILDELHKLDKKESIDIIYLGKCLETCTKMINIKDNIYRANNPSCCHAVVVKHSFAKKVLEGIDNCANSAINCDLFNGNIDVIFKNHIVHRMANGIAIHPSIFYQDVLTGGSDLRSNFLINYQECDDTDSRINKREIIIIASLVIIIIILILIFNRKRLGVAWKRLGAVWNDIGTKVSHMRRKQNS